MNMCIEKNVLFDDVIVLQDKENSEFLLQRYYYMNKEEIDVKIQVRKEEEERKKRVIEEERRQVVSEIKLRIRFFFFVGEFSGYIM